VENGCIKCHANYTTGTIGGCLSIFFPAAGLKLASKSDHIRLGLAGASLILLTILILFFLLRYMVIRPLSDLEAMASQISKGNLKARVEPTSGDELARLGKVFNTMAGQLHRNRAHMEERVSQATLELSAANSELQKIDELKTDFIADMSHELRSPITALQGGIDYLKRTIIKPDNRKYLTIMDNNLLRMTHLVSDLLDLTRMEGMKEGWNFEENDLTGLILEVIEILSIKASEKKLTINFAETGAIFVMMDIERIEQVLVNLLENAIKFSDPGHTIVFAVDPGNEEITVSVEDQGRGIRKDSIDKIFDKFHTLPSGSGDGRTKGTGLGLTISRKIIQSHGGRIWAESIFGKGSKFFFTIPCRHEM
jgi:signal transduction histidine kinase